MKAWPGPLVRLFLGEITLATVLAAADDRDPTKKREQVCEANFHGGQLALITGEKDQATRLFRLAADECPEYFIELEGAKAELRALGAH
jgi:lipoprotein NlpI